jgi:hypothetical protein
LLPRLHAPAAVRTPYGRDLGAFLNFAQRGYVVISQDCRATGESEPDSWNHYLYEPEDGYDLVEWVSQQHSFEKLRCWRETVRENTIESCPTVIHCRMGVNEWRTVPRYLNGSLNGSGRLSTQAPQQVSQPGQIYLRSQ